MHSEQPVSFPDWKFVLANSVLSSVVKSAHAREIITFLHHCKKTHSPATVSVIKDYLAAKGDGSPTRSADRGASPVREALRWFYQAGRECRPPAPKDAPNRTPGRATGREVEADQAAVLPKALREHHALRPMEPRPAALDLGGPDWEQAFVKTMRLRGLLWRSEQTYRGWAMRFARFIAPKAPGVATGEEVGAFLTDLAVNHRASPSSQRQALNALVFLMQEALGHKLGKLDFKRAFPKKRVPVVLTSGECQGIFNQLDGTTRLMAELMYGSGVRLMELLRLRVHHLDLERLRLQVHGGKGDRVKLTPRG